MGKIGLNILIGIVFLLNNSAGKVFERCDLANLLQSRYALSREVTANLVCIAQHGSGFNTAAQAGSPGSGSYGLWHISDAFWCGTRSQDKNVCGLSCSKLQDESLDDDLRCVKSIMEEHERLSGDGFNAWAAYTQYCKDKAFSYIDDCLTGAASYNTLKVTVNQGKPHGKSQGNPFLANKKPSATNQKPHPNSIEISQSNPFLKPRKALSSQVAQAQINISKKGKIYKRCELAQEMYFKHNFAMQDIPTWVCIAKHESRYDTAAVGRLNADGSADHGLFQISDLYWCTHDKRGGKGCQTTCDKFLDEDISDDVECVKTIHDEHTRISGDGFNAWTVYEPHCRAQSMEKIQDCFDEDIIKREMEGNYITLDVEFDNDAAIRYPYAYKIEQSVIEYTTRRPVAKFVENHPYGTNPFLNQFDIKDVKNHKAFGTQSLQKSTPSTTTSKPRVQAGSYESFKFNPYLNQLELKQDKKSQSNVVGASNKDNYPKNPFFNPKPISNAKWDTTSASEQISYTISKPTVIVNPFLSQLKPTENKSSIAAAANSKDYSSNPFLASKQSIPTRSFTTSAPISVKSSYYHENPFLLSKPVNVEASSSSTTGVKSNPFFYKTVSSSNALQAYSSKISKPYVSSNSFRNKQPLFATVPTIKTTTKASQSANNWQWQKPTPSPTNGPWPRTTTNWQLQQSSTTARNNWLTAPTKQPPLLTTRKPTNTWQWQPPSTTPRNNWSTTTAFNWRTNPTTTTTKKPLSNWQWQQTSTTPRSASSTAVPTKEPFTRTTFNWRRNPTTTTTKKPSTSWQWQQPPTSPTSASSQATPTKQPSTRTTFNWLTTPVTTTTQKPSTSWQWQQPPTTPRSASSTAVPTKHPSTRQTVNWRTNPTTTTTKKPSTNWQWQQPPTTPRSASSTAVPSKQLSTRTTFNWRTNPTTTTTKKPSTNWQWRQPSSTTTWSTRTTTTTSEACKWCTTPTSLTTKSPTNNWASDQPRTTTTKKYAWNATSPTVTKRLLSSRPETAGNKSTNSWNWQQPTTATPTYPVNTSTWNWRTPTTTSPTTTTTIHNPMTKWNQYQGNPTPTTGSTWNWHSSPQSVPPKELMSSSKPSNVLVTDPFKHPFFDHFKSSFEAAISSKTSTTRVPLVDSVSSQNPH